ncbi:hypothetical protein F5B22DRAFT_653836 [Xylaria bambusicola]|uniref:uncharacterized protein n=1 Tax=Xylaria bambusicola TaxID=326684 RepID=UPI002008762E|nr:uncharacterized protein F5B22DRAFT_653836 [Xylaria bambusicola]KAI0520890.1 hypothetical protein F5B22DRAFT_653836 [Xylaria bambusicola]
MEVQRPLNEFHLYPKLPLELQDMIWKFYSASLPDVRHDLHKHKNRDDGSTTYHYMRYYPKVLANIETKFLMKEDGFSSVHGALAMPKAVFSEHPHRVGYPGSRNEEPLYVAVNYENDIFSFAKACCHYYYMEESYGEQIANWFGLPAQLMKDHVEAPKGETQLGIFSARRLAFGIQVVWHPSLPTFTDFDLQLLRKFKRLKEIFIIVLELSEVPTAIRNRVSPRPEDHPVYGGYMVIAHLDDTETAQLLAAHDNRIRVTYALDLEWRSDPFVEFDIFQQ